MDDVSLSHAIDRETVGAVREIDIPLSGTVGLPTERQRSRRDGRLADDGRLVALLLLDIEIVDIKFEIDCLTHHQDHKLVFDALRQREDHLVEQRVLGCCDTLAVHIVGGAIGSQRLERVEVVIGIDKTNL